MNHYYAGYFKKLHTWAGFLFKHLQNFDGPADNGGPLFSEPVIAYE